MTLLGKVFVPGGLPSVTYNPRETLELETKVGDYLSELSSTVEEWTTFNG